MPDELNGVSHSFVVSNGTTLNSGTTGNLNIVYDKEKANWIVTQPAPEQFKDIIKENGESFDIYKNALTFGELERAVKISQYSLEIGSLYWNYQFILTNILNTYEIPTIDMIRLIYQLTEDFIERLTDIEDDYDLSEFSYSNAGFSLLKDNSGNLWWFGVPTNKFLDRQNDIISEAAHIDYVAAIEKGEINYPDLYYWHIPIKIGTTEWIEYDQRGFLVAGGKILKKYEGMVASVVKNATEPLGMSHLSNRATFVRDENRRVITKYRSHELTFLPLSEAANELTAFTGLADNED